MDGRLLQQLRGWNPWWLEGPDGLSRFGVPTFKREAYAPIMKTYKEGNQSVSIVGLRQVGKTTIMHQCIKELLEDGVPPQRIFYLSFEDSYLTAKYNVKTLFHDVIAEYAENVIKEDINRAKEKLYFFFDEVHRLPNWATSIKTYYDQHTPISFMVSGSASFGMQKSKGDSLLGRMAEHT
ncbi:AAA family ATPase, partial [Candidatus Uhrbacteria bacterium]|nr:AAA family ATPase [Candidatus Uhrbacteria bacterium]